MLPSANRYQEPSEQLRASDGSPSLAEQDAQDVQVSTEESMFSIEMRQDAAGRVIVIGRPTRKRAEAFLNIPISDDTRRRLDEQVVGSLAMGTSALLEWALKELQRRGISIEARPQD